MEVGKRRTWRCQTQATCGQSRPGGLQHSGEEESSRSTVGWVPGAFGGRRLVGPKERRRPRRTHPHTWEAPQGTYNGSHPQLKPALAQISAGSNPNPD